MHLAHYTADAVVTSDLKTLFRSEFSSLGGTRQGAEEGADSASSHALGRDCGKVAGVETGGGQVAARRAGCLTVLLYGQTGTGKTYSMKELAALFFERHAAEGGEARCAGDSHSDAGNDFVYELQCFEVLHKGNTVFDLLDSRAKVTLLEDGNGVVHCRARRQQVPGSAPQQAHLVLQEALALRMSEATERNAASSRSHAFFVIKKRIRVKGGGGGQEEEWETVETLRLVDLAGSERNFETQLVATLPPSLTFSLARACSLFRVCVTHVAAASIMPWRTLQSLPPSISTLPVSLFGLFPTLQPSRPAAAYAASQASCKYRADARTHARARAHTHTHTH